MKLALYIARRLLLLAPMALGVTLAGFLLGHAVPADPVSAFLGEQAAGDPQTVAAFRHRWGLDRSLPAQYAIYIRNLVQGDMGTSLSTRQPVTLDLRQHFPATIELATTATLLSILAGIPLGILAAVKRNNAVDQAIRILTVCGVSMPIFWLGLVTIIVFYAWLGWVPAPGRLSAQIPAPPFTTGFVVVDALLAGRGATAVDALQHLILPAIVLSFYGLGLTTRMMRGSMLDVLSMDYMRTARAKGVPELAAIVRHAVRNGLIPVVTVIGLNFGNLLAGSVVIETVFSWPGLGQYAFESTVSLDFPAIMGVGIVVAFVYMIVNLFVDVAYGLINPRIRVG